MHPRDINEPTRYPSYETKHCGGGDRGGNVKLEYSKLVVCLAESPASCFNFPNLLLSPLTTRQEELVLSSCMITMTTRATTTVVALRCTLSTRRTNHNIIILNHNQPPTPILVTIAAITCSHKRSSGNLLQLLTAKLTPV